MNSFNYDNITNRIKFFSYQSIYNFLNFNNRFLEPLPNEIALENIKNGAFTDKECFFVVGVLNDENIFLQPQYANAISRSFFKLRLIS